MSLPWVRWWGWGIHTPEHANKADYAEDQHEMIIMMKPIYLRAKGETH